MPLEHVYLAISLSRLSPVLYYFVLSHLFQVTVEMDIYFRFTFRFVYEFMFQNRRAYNNKKN